jgi:hypothetical protein
MIDWQATAATIHCRDVDDDVTITVYPNWSSRCSGLVKYTTSRDASLELVKRSLAKKLALECREAGCRHIAEYIEQLKNEEVRRGRATS